MNISLSGIEDNQKLDISLSEALSVPEQYGLLGSSPVVNFNGIIRKSEDDFFLEGGLRSDIKLPCGKCLQDVKISVSSPVFERFTTENTCDEDAWRVHSLSKVDISPQILLNLQLVIPMSVSCSDDCKGICRYCGKNRNEIICNCDELNREIDPRLEKLKELF